MLESRCEGRKRGGKKRFHFFILVFCFCVLLTEYSNQSVTVYATEDEKESMSGNSVSDNSTEPETEPVPQSQGEAMWQAQAGGEWYQGSLAEAIAGAYSGGTVVLLSDILLTDEITISKSVLIKSNDIGSPCTIKNISQDTDDRVSRGRIFTVNGGPVTLENVILDGGRNEGIIGYHPLICVTNVGMMLRDGAVLQNAETHRKVYAAVESISETARFLCMTVPKSRTVKPSMAAA